MERNNYKEIAKISNIQIPLIENWMIGKLIKSIHDPYKYSNVQSLVMSLPINCEKEAIEIIKYLDSHEYINVNRRELNTYGIMCSTDNINVKIRGKLKNILNNI